MNLPKQPQIHTMVFRATSNELIALGHVVTQYITQMRRIPNPTKEQLEIVALLKSFQGDSFKTYRANLPHHRGDSCMFKHNSIEESEYVWGATLIHQLKAPPLPEDQAKQIKTMLDVPLMRKRITVFSTSPKVQKGSGGGCWE